MSDVMPRKRWAGHYGDFWKKQLVEVQTWASPVGSTGCATRLLGQPVEIWSWTRRVQFVAYGMRRAFVGSDGTVSIVKIVCVSLSTCRKTKLKKSINVSYQNSASGHDVIHVLCRISYLGFYCDISDCHIRPARMNTCTQCVHLTNSCTKQKGSQPN